MNNAGVVSEYIEPTKENKEKIYDRHEIINDYKLALISRQLSILGRKEVLNGKAKFGIFGDGKEIAQIAFAKNFRNGDWRSGYYRDQTFMLAAGMLSIDEFFYQLYGDTRIEKHPSSGGRSFNNHFASRSIHDDGTWKELVRQKNTSSDISPTAGQMPRLLGLGLASKLFRNNKILHSYSHLSSSGNEVAFGMIGDASTSEGHFFETMNAAAVLQIPVAVSVWDDGYGISVPRKIQTVKDSISEALKGFHKEGKGNGILIYKIKGWDYEGLVKYYHEGIKKCREEHIPVLFHIEEMVQPLGHSTSGSHERYKSKERLAWELSRDPIVRFEEWIVGKKLAGREELEKLKDEVAELVVTSQKKVWKDYNEPFMRERNELISIVKNRKCSCEGDNAGKIDDIVNKLEKVRYPIRKDNISSAKQIIRNICAGCQKKNGLKDDLRNWLTHHYLSNIDKYTDFLYNETNYSALNVESSRPVYHDESPMVNGREILRDNFDQLLTNNPLMVIFGEDVGHIGGVNQCLEGLQKKHGVLRIFDCGIRETSIIGKGIGLALRGLRPIAEIQYFDYLLYGLQTLSDDLATTSWRTRGGQIAPLIIRTRGHRLEGIWHSGSPLSMVINSIRGIYVCVPRNMTQAAGMYNTLLQGQDPALIIEPLNAYRLKEKKPENPGDYRIPLGIPEVITEGSDITLVTYGSCVRIALDAVNHLQEHQISVELIDVQTLLPFDLNHIILDSIKKTGRVLFFDEDVPGGATSYMMQQVVEGQNAYSFLKQTPRTLSARDHRPAYGTDGDYFSNPNAENVFDMVYNMMNVSDPWQFPDIYG